MRFGERGTGVETASLFCHADTFFAALCFGVLETAGETRLLEMLEAFQDEPPFIVSSLFPRVGTVRFVPRPPTGRRRVQPAPDPGNPQDRKALKKLKHVSWRLYQELIADPNLSPLEIAQPGPDGDAWHLPGEREAMGDASAASNWWDRARLPRVTVDRQTGASTLFFSRETLFAQGAGLHLLVQWFDETSWRPAFEQALSALGDSGIGGERSSGKGQFDWHGPVSMPLPAQSARGTFMTISPYCPREHELAGGILGPDASWSLVTRGGWVGASGARSRRHRPVTMIEVGSVLHHPQSATGQALGQLVEVTPRDFERPFSVWRYGYAFPIPIGSGRTSSEEQAT